jgi:Zn-dependent peptidase ImmA (M78 family)/transcriptional regulator with XRE-family HTH domain
VAGVEHWNLGDLLRRARERSGLSQQAAADAIGLNRVMVSYYEGGRRQPSLPIAGALARLYGLDLADLLEQAAPRPEPADVLFRAASTTLSARARAGMAEFSSLARAYTELVDDLGGELPGRGGSPFPEARPNAGRKEAARLARELRDHLAVGDGPLGDHLFQVAGDVALVFRLPLGEDDGSPSGFFYNHARAGFCLTVNSEMSLGRQVFTVAHELAHAFFHSQGSDVWISFPQAPAARERFADFFAGQVLVPEDALANAVDELDAWDELEDPIVAVHLQRHFGVSYATLLVRLRQEGFVTAREYQELRQISPSRLAVALGYEVNPADLGDHAMRPFDRFPGPMVRLVRRAVGEGLITTGDAAETLGLSREEILALLDRPRARPSELRALEEMEGGARLR